MLTCCNVRIIEGLRYKIFGNELVLIFFSLSNLPSGCLHSKSMTQLGLGGSRNLRAGSGSTSEPRFRVRTGSRSYKEKHKNE
jgi:hypothetical protein